MRLPEYCNGLEWAYPADAEVLCLRRLGAGRMLCGLFLNPGQYVGFVPTLQPADPEPVCPSCVVTLATMLGDCPVCGARVLCEGGRVATHDGCKGTGLVPRSER